MAEPKFVLIAEDDDDIRELIAESLQSEAGGLNLQVVQVRDAIEAMNHVSRREFHCVITDLKMPRAGGEELLRSIQGDALNANTPTVVVSGHMDDDFNQRYRNVRAFKKPFIPSELAQTVVREIKLGRTDDRVAVHLLNPFVTAMKTLFEKEMKMQPKVGAPQVKKAGDEPHGAFHCTVIFTTGPVQSRFTMSFEKDWLAHVKTSYFGEQGLGMTTDGVARQVSLLVFERVVPELIPIMGGTPRVSGMSIANANKESECAELIKAAGITVSLETDQGRIIAGAFSKGKTRRM